MLVLATLSPKAKTNPKKKQPHLDSQLLADSSFQSLMILCHILRFSPLVLTSVQSSSSLHSTLGSPYRAEGLEAFLQTSKAYRFKHQRYERLSACLVTCFWLHPNFERVAKLESFLLFCCFSRSQKKNKSHALS